MTAKTQYDFLIKPYKCLHKNLDLNNPFHTETED